MPKTDHHSWENYCTNEQPLNKQDKWSVWECQVCHAKFKHYYGRHVDWRIDRDEQEIDLFCGEIGRAQVTAEAIKEMEEEKKKKEVVEAIVEKEEEEEVEQEEKEEEDCRRCFVSPAPYTHAGKKYCWSCMMKVKEEQKLCNKCEVTGTQNKCKRCHQYHCENHLIQSTVCVSCTKFDDEFLSFLVGKAQYHNWNDAASHFYGDNNKRQRIE